MQKKSTFMPVEGIDVLFQLSNEYISLQVEKLCTKILQK